MGIFPSISGSGIGSVGMGMLTNVIFWMGLVIFLIAGSYGALRYRIRKKLRFPVLELIMLGGGKVAVNYTKAGWFRSGWFFKLFDYKGNSILMTKDRREIQNADAEDFHDIWGSRGLIVLRKGDDNDVLVPLDAFDVQNRELIGNIAPADFRDTAIRLNRRTEEETKSMLERYAPIIVGSISLIVLFLTILFIIQYAKHSQAESWEQTQKALKMAYENRGAVTPSQAPLYLPILSQFFKRKK